MPDGVFIGEPVRKSADVLSLHLTTLAGQTVKPSAADKAAVPEPAMVVAGA